MGTINVLLFKKKCYNYDLLKKPYKTKLWLNKKSGLYTDLKKNAFNKMNSTTYHEDNT